MNVDMVNGDVDGSVVDCSGSTNGTGCLPQTTTITTVSRRATRTTTPLSTSASASTSSTVKATPSAALEYVDGLPSTSTTTRTRTTTTAAITPTKATKKHSRTSADDDVDLVVVEDKYEHEDYDGEDDEEATADVAAVAANTTSSAATFRRNKRNYEQEQKQQTKQHQHQILPHTRNNDQVTTNTNNAAGSHNLSTASSSSLFDVSLWHDLCRTCGKPSVDLASLYVDASEEEQPPSATMAMTTTAAAMVASTSSSAARTPSTSTSSSSTKIPVNQSTMLHHSSGNGCDDALSTQRPSTLPATTSTTDPTAVLHDQNSTFIDAILQEMQIWNLRIKPNDGLPQRICPKCRAQFSIIGKFRRKCLKVQIRLRTLNDELRLEYERGGGGEQQPQQKMRQHVQKSIQQQSESASITMTPPPTVRLATPVTTKSTAEYDVLPHPQPLPVSGNDLINDKSTAANRLSSIAASAVASASGSATAIVAVNSDSIGIVADKQQMSPSFHNAFDVADTRSTEERRSVRKSFGRARRGTIAEIVKTTGESSKRPNITAVRSSRTSLPLEVQLRRLSIADESDSTSTSVDDNITSSRSNNCTPSVPLFKAEFESRKLDFRIAPFASSIASSLASRNPAAKRRHNSTEYFINASAQLHTFSSLIAAHNTTSQQELSERHGTQTHTIKTNPFIDTLLPSIKSLRSTCTTTSTSATANSNNNNSLGYGPAFVTKAALKEYNISPITSTNIAAKKKQLKRKLGPLSFMRRKRSLSTSCCPTSPGISLADFSRYCSVMNEPPEAEVETETETEATAETVDTKTLDENTDGDPVSIATAADIGETETETETDLTKNKLKCSRTEAEDNPGQEMQITAAMTIKPCLIRLRAIPSRELEAIKKKSLSHSGLGQLAGEVLAARDVKELSSQPPQMLDERDNNEKKFMSESLDSQKQKQGCCVVGNGGDVVDCSNDDVAVSSAPIPDDVKSETSKCEEGNEKAIMKTKNDVERNLRSSAKALWLTKAALKEGTATENDETNNESTPTTNSNKTDVQINDKGMGVTENVEQSDSNSTQLIVEGTSCCSSSAPKQVKLILERKRGARYKCKNPLDTSKEALTIKPKRRSRNRKTIENAEKKPDNDVKEETTNSNADTMVYRTRSHSREQQQQQQKMEAQRLLNKLECVNKEEKTAKAAEMTKEISTLRQETSIDTEKDTQNVVCEQEITNDQWKSEQVQTYKPPSPLNIESGKESTIAMDTDQNQLSTQSAKLLNLTPNTDSKPNANSTPNSNPNNVEPDQSHLNSECSTKSIKRKLSEEASTPTAGTNDPKNENENDDVPAEKKICTQEPDDKAIETIHASEESDKSGWKAQCSNEQIIQSLTTEKNCDNKKDYREYIDKDISDKNKNEDQGEGEGEENVESKENNKVEANVQTMTAIYEPDYQVIRSKEWESNRMSSEMNNSAATVQQQQEAEEQQDEINNVATTTSIVECANENESSDTQHETSRKGTRSKLLVRIPFAFLTDDFKRRHIPHLVEDTLKDAGDHENHVQDLNNENTMNCGTMPSDGDNSVASQDIDAGSNKTDKLGFRVTNVAEVEPDPETEAEPDDNNDNNDNAFHESIEVANPENVAVILSNSDENVQQDKSNDGLMVNENSALMPEVTSDNDNAMMMADKPTTATQEGLFIENLPSNSESKASTTDPRSSFQFENHNFQEELSSERHNDDFENSFSASFEDSCDAYRPEEATLTATSRINDYINDFQAHCIDSNDIESRAATPASMAPFTPASSLISQPTTPMHIDVAPPPSNMTTASTNQDEMDDVETTLNGILNEMQDQHIYTPVSTHTDDFFSQSVYSPFSEPPDTPLGTGSMYADSPATSIGGMVGSGGGSCMNEASSPYVQHYGSHQVSTSYENTTYSNCRESTLPNDESTTQSELIGFQNDIPCFENIEMSSTESVKSTTASSGDAGTPPPPLSDGGPPDGNGAGNEGGDGIFLSGDSSKDYALRQLLEDFEATERQQYDSAGTGQTCAPMLNDNSCSTTALTPTSKPAQWTTSNSEISELHTHSGVTQQPQQTTTYYINANNLYAPNPTPSANGTPTTTTAATATATATSTATPPLKQPVGYHCHSGTQQPTEILKSDSNIDTNKNYIGNAQQQQQIMIVIPQEYLQEGNNTATPIQQVFTSPVNATEYNHQQMQQQQQLAYTAAQQQRQQTVLPNHQTNHHHHHLHQQQQQQQLKQHQQQQLHQKQLQLHHQHQQQQLINSPRISSIHHQTQYINATIPPPMMSPIPGTRLQYYPTTSTLVQPPAATLHTNLPHNTSNISSVMLNSPQHPMIQSHPPHQQYAAPPHREQRNQKINLTCRFCHKRPKFTNNLDYSNHIIALHPEQKPYNCPHCPMHFVRRTQRQQHILEEHGAKRFQCAQCGDSFSTQRAMDSHLQRAHAPDTPQTTGKEQAATIASSLSPRVTSGSGVSSGIGGLYGVRQQLAPWRDGSTTTSAALVRIEDVHLHVSNESGRSKRSIDLQLDASTPVNKESADTLACKPRILCCPDCDESNNSHDCQHGSNNTQLHPQEQQSQNAEQLQQQQQQHHQQEQQEQQQKHHQQQQQQQQQQIHSHLSLHVTMPSPEQTEPDSTTTLRRFRRRRINSSKQTTIPTNCTTTTTTPTIDDTSSADLTTERLLRNSHNCLFCDEQFTNEIALRKHHQLAHGNQATTMPYVCSICKRGFRMRTALQRHMESHEIEGRPFECSDCHVRFPRPSHLTLHKLTVHAMMKPHACQECGKQFGTESAVKTHMKFHGEKSISCDMCERKFFLMKDMRKHRRSVHFGVHFYKCDICPSSFLHHSRFSAHMKNHLPLGIYLEENSPTTLLAGNSNFNNNNNANANNNNSEDNKKNIIDPDNLVDPTITHSLGNTNDYEQQSLQDTQQQLNQHNEQYEELAVAELQQEHQQTHQMENAVIPPSPL